MHCILAITAVAVLLCYPVFFLYEDPTTGISKLPYHVWTSARRFVGSQPRKVDVEIRQVWIHGSYMKALDQHVLEEGLNVQNIVLGDMLPTAQRTDERDQSYATTWGFHSPLIFWNCSEALIREDKDILRTINEQSHRRTMLNLTLRPSSVFAGKSFDRKRLTAADSLVITLFDKGDTNFGKDWTERLKFLQVLAPDRWSMYPDHRHELRSQLYQFQFKPMSLRDDFFLFAAYILMSVYFFISLRKLRAVKSKVGLIITIVSEMLICITASFTICVIMQVDLARVPQEVYPFVVLVIGLENRFRLINAVLSTPQGPIVHRMATAVGDVGHLSLAAAAQNLFLLWLFTKFVSSGVASFCTFAAVALVFDYVLHLTFFVAVLGVDVQRMDLQESLDRVTIVQERSKGCKPSKRSYWFDALWQGRLPVSSRLAGTVVSVCFVLILNMHFENESTLRALYVGIKSLFHRQKPSVDGNSYELPPINQARTPVAWLRIQDYDSAKEVIEFVKPGAYGLLARVYDPVTIVLHGSDRGKVPKAKSLLSEMTRLLDEHLSRLLLVVILALAFVTLLMQYLLWNELPEPGTEELIHDQALLSVKTLPKAHRLDIVKLAGCSRGHITAVGLDRSTSIAQFDTITGRYSLSVLFGASMTPPLWPINIVTTDDSGTWAALLSDDGNVAVWNISERRLEHLVETGLRGKLPTVFCLLTMALPDGDRLRLLILTAEGSVIEFDVAASRSVCAFELCPGPVGKGTISHSKTHCRIFAVSRATREVHIAHWQLGEWTLGDVTRTESGASGELERIRSLSAAPALSLVALIHSKGVVLKNTQTFQHVHTLQMPSVKGSTFRIVSFPRRECPLCHSAAVTSISFAYVHAEDHYCWFRTWKLPPGDDNMPQLICLGPPNPNCNGLAKATETIHRIEEPGVWEATNVGGIIGVRKRHLLSDTPNSHASGSDAGYFGLDDAAVSHRRSISGSSRKSAHGGGGAAGANSPEWEAWALFSNGELHTEPLTSAGKQNGQTGTDARLSDENDLFVAVPGPVTRLGKRSIAVGLGNAIKVVAVGNEKFEDERAEGGEHGLLGNPRRRRVTGKGRGL